VLRLVHISDIHVGAHVDDLSDALVADVTSFDPLVSVVSGDLTMRARRVQFEQARDYLARLPAPQLVVPGNHDIPLHDVVTRMTDAFGKYSDHITDDLDPVLHLPGISVVGLTSMPHWRWKAGHVSDRQADLVREAGTGAEPGAVRVLVTHHPVLPRELSGLIGRRSLVAAAADAGIDLLLAGHTHDPQVARVTLSSDAADRQALSIVAGTAISERTRHSLNCYFRIEVTSQHICAIERQWTGREWVDGMSVRFTRHLG
jgi:3',5'-cyclic AMP phosphodiesterase CpdA